MEIERYHRQARQIPSAGNIIPRQADTYAEEGQLGMDIAQTALGIEAVDEKIRVAEANDQIANASIQADQAFEEFRNSLDPNDTKNWDDQIEEFYKTKLGEIGEGITSKYAKDDWPFRLEAKKARYGRILGTQKRSINVSNYQKAFYRREELARILAAEQKSLDEYNMVSVDQMETQYGLGLKEGHEKDKELKIENFEIIEGREDPMLPDEENARLLGELYLRESKELYNVNQIKAFKEDMIADALENGPEIINKLKPEDRKDIGLTQDDIDDIRRDYQTRKNNAESIIRKERDLRAKTIERDIWQLQASNDPNDNRKALELYNTSEAQELLSVPVLRTLRNGFNKTKTFTSEQKSKAHAEGVQAMVNWRAGKSLYDETKKIIDRLNAEGSIDSADGQAWVEELLGFTKPPASMEKSATALGFRSLERLRTAQLGSFKSTNPNDLVGMAKIESEWNQRITNQQAELTANPDWTEAQINKSFAALLEPAKEQMAREVVRGGWPVPKSVQDLYPPFGGPGRGRLAQVEKMPRIKTDEEWENLAPGTEFIDPNGRVRVK